jgi:SAM-dependent methyltransferase
MLNTTLGTVVPEGAVSERYSAAAEQREAALCCPVTYDTSLLEKIPAEIIEKDYGCGDPTAYVKEGDVVVDLGSGGGKLCYITSQVVGPTGRVIGVDCNQTMLGLARKYRGEMAEKLGYGNVEFRYGRIQDLSLDLDELNKRMDALDSEQASRPIEFLNLMRSLRTGSPMIESDSVDCVISNCVLNLVNPDDRKQLFREIYRVLKRGGRAAISDIVCDEDVPLEMQQDGHLWSGCLSGAWREDRFIEEFAEVGFHGIEISKYQSEPWQVINGIEFRSATVLAYKGKEGRCLERNQAVMYKGPFEQAKDDDGHIYRRGQRVAVCEKTFKLLMQAPYEGMFVPVEPLEEIPLDEAKDFDCKRARLRSPRETKGLEYDATVVSDGSVCDSSSGCC